MDRNRVSRKGGWKIRSINWTDLEHSVISGPDADMSGCTFKFIKHSNAPSETRFPHEMYIRTTTPLHHLFRMLTTTQSRIIARQHGISVKSRSTLSDLCSLASTHSCVQCNLMCTVFEIVRSRPSERQAESGRPKQHTRDEEITQDQRDQNKLLDFPPTPPSDGFIRDIIRRCCARMTSDKIEEAGCAVCGQLTSKSRLSALKNVKNFLHILRVPGIMRRERSSTRDNARCDDEPVLANQCSAICDTCRSEVRKGKVPQDALARGSWIGDVPRVLSELQFAERLLIARVRHTCTFVKVQSGMRKMKANVIAFENPTPKVYNILPPPRDEMEDVLAILFVGPNKPTSEDFERAPVLVRQNKVIAALEWLKLNHVDYYDIDISYENMQQYSEDKPYVGVAWKAQYATKSPEGLSVHDNEEEDGVVDGECPFIVHGLTGEKLETMTSEKMKAYGLMYLNNNGKVLAVGQNDMPEKIWKNPQLYPKMFPWLFPYGCGGIESSGWSDEQHVKYLMMYYDKHFQQDPTFSFVAFSHSQIKSTSQGTYLLADKNKFTAVAD